MGCVLPTCVGMVRESMTALAFVRRSPHVRGDGPQVHLHSRLAEPFSPRAWGWSANRRIRLSREKVLPTCVGMVRTSRTEHVYRPGSPHVRGDGPFTEAPGSLPGVFSPRAWGWSAVREVKTPRVPVLPTCVGMVRR